MGIFKKNLTIKDMFTYFIVGVLVLALLRLIGIFSEKFFLDIESLPKILYIPLFIILVIIFLSALAVVAIIPFMIIERLDKGILGIIIPVGLIIAGVIGVVLIFNYTDKLSIALLLFLLLLALFMVFFPLCILLPERLQGLILKKWPFLAWRYHRKQRKKKACMEKELAKIRGEIQEKKISTQFILNPQKEKEVFVEAYKVAESIPVKKIIRVLLWISILFFSFIIAYTCKKGLTIDLSFILIFIISVIVLGILKNLLIPYVLYGVETSINPSQQSFVVRKFLLRHKKRGSLKEMFVNHIFPSTGKEPRTGKWLGLSAYYNFPSEPEKKPIEENEKYLGVIVDKEIVHFDCVKKIDSFGYIPISCQYESGGVTYHIMVEYESNKKELKKAWLKEFSLHFRPPIEYNEEGAIEEEARWVEILKEKIKQWIDIMDSFLAGQVFWENFKSDFRVKGVEVFHEQF